ncbi:helix-turn-helix domain-containing protein [Mucilaginibacter sp. AK015]|uniref:helix-turn-helix domain-containing protein n=1 Tax=Mucilaginibacter sp. AK015 TaxID=2723072 RepID=UPI001609CDC1|nr:helix-turn-helix domain-containing protein [Mucilaginibacter sp. AK015]MBB5394801.1 CRP-like cAMP-binding protein [Mucilaginibacter sp. AK015]
MCDLGCIAQALLRLEKQFGNDADGAINFRFAWTDLADLTAATYETVFRTVKSMVNEELLSISHNRITIKNHPGLAALMQSPQA